MGRVPVTSKEELTEERRREAEASFLVATEGLLAEGGSYADLSVERIAAAAGRSRTAFYLYFRDKRELLIRLTENVASELYEIAEGWWSGEGGREDLHRALTRIFATWREHADLLRAVVEAATYDAEVSRFWRDVVERFIVATEERMVREGEDPERARGKAFALVWMTERACYQHIVRGASRDDAVLVDTQAEIWERAIYGTA